MHFQDHKKSIRIGAKFILQEKDDSQLYNIYMKPIIYLC